MNEVVPTDPPAEARPDQRPTDARPGRWGPRLRWFAAEFTVVVAGILVALAIHAWWQGQQDRAKERMYLLQIAADLQETERIVMEADSVSRSRERAGNLFLRAYFTPQRPPLDSLLVWRRQANWYSNPIPVVATIEALVATGDLALVRDDGLRLAITTYLAASRQQMTQSQSYADMWTRGADQVDSRLDFAEALVAFHDSAQLDSLSRTNALYMLPPGPRRRPFPAADAEALLSDRLLYDGLSLMNIARLNLAGIRTGMLQSARTLRADVEADLAQ